MVVIRCSHRTRGSAARASRKLGVSLCRYQGRGCPNPGTHPTIASKPLTERYCGLATVTCWGIRGAAILHWPIPALMRGGSGPWFSPARWCRWRSGWRTPAIHDRLPPPRRSWPRSNAAVTPSTRSNQRRTTRSSRRRRCARRGRARRTSPPSPPGPCRRSRHRVRRPRSRGSPCAGPSAGSGRLRAEPRA